MALSPDDFKVKNLGENQYESPLDLSKVWGDGIANYVTDDACVLYQATSENGEGFHMELKMERGGPRERLFFHPPQTRAALVTCGGLSPGLNNVIRSIFLELHHKYQVKEVLGFQYGYRGMKCAWIGLMLIQM